MMGRAFLPLCESLYRLTLRSFWPERLEAESGGDVLDCFGRLARDRLEAEGVLALAAVTIRGMLDLVRTGVEERRRLRPRARERARRSRFMDTFAQSLRFALRSLAAARASSLLVVVTLAVGIGANAALLELGYRVLWRPLPFEEPDRLVSLYETDETSPEARGSVAPGNFEDWKSARSLEALGAQVETSVNLTGEGVPERLLAYRASASLFPVLGVEPFLGRLYDHSEDASGGPSVAVLGYRFWQRRFGGSPNVIGRTVLLDDVPHEVLGVLPEGLAYPRRDAQIFLPLGFDEEERSTRSSHYLDVVGRLRDGVTLEEARAEMRALGRRIAEAHPRTNAGETVRVLPLHDDLVSSARSPILLVLGAVGAVLLIACVNVSNLLLARASGRRREVSLRAALGATRGRLVAQFLTEAVVLALMGGCLGALFRHWASSAFEALVPAYLPVRDALSGVAPLGGLATTIALSLAVGVLVGLLPAWQLSRPSRAFAEGGVRGVTAGAHGSRARHALVVLEIALALVLLLGAGVMLRSFVRLVRESPGFEAEQVLTMRVELSRTRYGEHAAKSAFYRELIERIERNPSVVTAGFVTMLPLTFPGGQSGFDLVDLPEPEDDTYAYLRSTTPHYFRAIGARLLAGEAFEDGDDGEAEQTVVVNESFARRYLDGDAVGHSIRIWGEPHRIVGVVADIKETSLRREGLPTMYVSVFQRSFGFFDPRDLAVRARGNPEDLAESIRAEVWAVDPEQPVSSIRTLDRVVAGSVSEERFQTTALVLFSGAALLLASLGIYGVLAYAVTQRTGEIGLRVALGARPSDVLRMVLRQGMLPVAVGLGLGLVVASAFTRFIASFLYGVDATDPGPIIAITALLTAVALMACLVPSVRALRVDPLVALRDE